MNWLYICFFHPVSGGAGSRLCSARVLIRSSNSAAACSESSSFKLTLLIQQYPYFLNISFLVITVYLLSFFLLRSVSHLHISHHSQNKQHPRHRFVSTIMIQCFHFSFISMLLTSSYASQQILYSLCITFFILLGFFKLSTAFDARFMLQSVGCFFYLVIFLTVQQFHLAL